MNEKLTATNFLMSPIVSSSLHLHGWIRDERESEEEDEETKEKKKDSIV